MNFENMTPEKVKALIASRTVEIDDTRKWLQHTVSPLVLKKHVAQSIDVDDAIDLEAASRDITFLSNLDAMLKMLAMLLGTLGKGADDETLDAAKEKWSAQANEAGGPPVTGGATVPE